MAMSTPTRHVFTADACRRITKNLWVASIKIGTCASTIACLALTLSMFGVYMTHIDNLQSVDVLAPVKRLDDPLFEWNAAGAFPKVLAAGAPSDFDEAEHVLGSGSCEHNERALLLDFTAQDSDRCWIDITTRAYHPTSSIARCGIVQSSHRHAWCCASVLPYGTMDFEIVSRVSCCPRRCVRAVVLAL